MAIGRSYAPVWVAAVVCLICLLPFAPSTQARVTTSVATGAFGTVDASMAGFRVGLKTDDETIQKEEEAINPDGLSVKEQKLAEEVEEFEFQAETHRLLDILVHSLYQNKDIFLRELISNASDALDKIRFLSLSDPEALGDSEESRKLEIKVSFDKEAGTLTIQDSGVGMTKQDLIQNLGTVAKSGTAAFVEQMASGADVSLIGQFGVGFYSGYLVADKVTVASKNNDDDQYIWESAADGTFSVAEDDGEPIARGTRIVLHLKEDALEYAEQQKLDELLKRYSQFITFPIYLNKSRTESVEVPVEDEEDDEEPVDDEDDEETDDGDDEEADELEAEDDEEEDDAPRTRTETRTVWEWVQVNNQKAIWTRSKNDISDEEYNEFFKSISKETDDPLAWTHFSAEGEIEFKSILFTPKKAPMGMFDDYYGKNANLRLYVRKVLISDEFEDFLPRYLNFVRGVVDSDDLPLNVSRESLQQSKVLKVMSKKLIRKVLEMLRKLAQKGQKDEEDDDEVVDAEDEEGEEEHPYITFWKEFGKNIKLGLIEDSSNRTKLSKLLRYKSTKSGEEGFVSLDEYVARMKDWQKSIYYIAGENMDAVKDSMFLERFAEKDVEVLFMTEPIDEYALQNLAEYDGHKLQSITKENLKFGDEGDQDKKRQEIYQENFAPLITFMKDTLGDKIEKAVISPRLAKSPCALVTGQYGYSANMERIMKAQAFADPSRAQYMISKKTLEINPRHPVIAELNRRVASEDEAETEQAQVTAQLLFDSALLTSGFSMDDPKDFAMRMHELMKRSLNLESLDLEAEVEVPEEEEEDDEEEEEEEDLDEEEGDDEDEDEEADEEDEDATGHEEL